MPSTTNFGWTTPADTDYVKDGANAIRTLGNGIDTSLMDLKGGTTGQILSKASNTDLDYTWINNDQGDITAVNAGTGISVTGGTGPTPTVAIDSTVATLTGTQTLTNKTIALGSNTVSGTTAQFNTALTDGDFATLAGTETLTNKTLTAPTISNASGVINNTLTTTTGDIIYASAANTPARLGIGSTNQVLTVSGGIPVWATPASTDSWTLLNTGGTTLTGSANVRIQSLSGSYRMLHIFIQDATSGGTNTMSVRFNNDSSSIYFSIQRHRYSDSTSGDLTSTNATSALVSYAENADGFTYLAIPDYANTTTWKIAQSVACRNDAINGIHAGGILWKSTSAINEVDIVCGANFTGGICYIYGEK